MKKMNPGKFFKCMIPAFAIGLLAWQFTKPIINTYITNPEHLAYDQTKAKLELEQENYQSLLRNEEEMRSFRIFDLVLAGRIEINSISDPYRIRAANLLLNLRRDGANRASEIRPILFKDYGGSAIFNHFVECPAFGRLEANRQIVPGCQLTDVMSVLNDDRLDKLWSNDPEIVDEALKTTTVPEPPAAIFPPSSPRYVVNDYLAWLIIWFVFSLPTATAFFLSGLIAQSADEKECGYPTRLKLVPGFLLGWLILMTLLPGYLFIQLLRFATSENSPIYGIFANEGFDNEYERTIAQLTRLKNRGVFQRNPELTARIDRAKIRIEKTKSAADLMNIRKQLVEVEQYAESLDETNQLLDESP